MADIEISELRGGKELCDWFGGEPSFHDARLTTLEIAQGAASTLVAETFHMSSETDEDGYFILSRHVAVRFLLTEVIACHLEDCMEATIIFDLKLSKQDDTITISFDSSYGAHGWITAKCVHVAFEPKQESAPSNPNSTLDFNLLEKTAARLQKEGRASDAIKVYLFMADGDSLLDAGYLAEKLGECYEEIGEIHAARYWYGRAVEENPHVRATSVAARARLDTIGIDDLILGA